MLNGTEWWAGGNSKSEALNSNQISKFGNRKIQKSRWANVCCFKAEVGRALRGAENEWKL